jgi:hypothetical protein
MIWNWISQRSHNPPMTNTPPLESGWGQNPKLSHRNSNDRFTSINGHNVGEFYLRCRPAFAVMRRRRRRFRRKGWPPPIVGPPGQQTTSRRAPQECPAPPGPPQWPAVNTHNRPPVPLILGVRSVARLRTRSCTAALPAARALAVNRAPRSPPSFTPRRLAAARTAFGSSWLDSSYSRPGLARIRSALPQ